ncbi:terpenoid synthase [Penicillium capsulatum]|nr:terpenoid synthase [Penicillium capsulatum]
MPFLGAVNEVDQLLQRCTGQKVQIPFLFDLFPAWRAHFNSIDDPSTQDELLAFQKRWIPNETAQKRNRGIDAVFFCRSVFPDAGLEDLKIAVIWLSWLDNQTDQMNQYRREMLSSIQWSLLGEGALDEDPALFAPTCRAAQAWYQIGVRIRHRVPSISERKFMFDTLRDYIVATIELQKKCDKAQILNIESYLPIRMDTSAVYPTISMYLYGQLDLGPNSILMKDHRLASHSHPPAWFLSHALVKEALRQINIIIALCNDIVSARHEIASGHVDNIIPLLVYHHDVSAQVAVDDAVQMMKTSYLEFQSLEVQLHALGQEHNISDEVDAFLNGCINLCMGAIQWT